LARNDRAGVTRITSAQKANCSERRFYEQGI
jgi:uncharacterized DUF497 family protein